MNEKIYPEEKSKPNFPEIEESILKFWKDYKIFEKSIKIREEQNAKDYVFYDGPPFANGLPHYGHILTGYVKDVVPRFFTMKGYRVPRRFGWDCHGLPAEMEMEKEAGLGGKKEIEEYGIDKFNEGCKKLVLKYVDEWERFVTRQGRWVDFAGAYKTMDLSYMESVIWAFKNLYDLGLIYQKERVVSYCARCETPLSNFETRMDDATRSRQDPSVTLRFKLKDKFENFPAYLLVWTTTPWTLPSNLAIAVGKDIEYWGILDQGELYLLAENRYELYKSIFQPDHQVVWKGTGEDLKDLRYTPLFSYFKDIPNAFKVLLADFVGIDEGTGIVHIAPGFGEDDQNLCNNNNIETVCPIDAQAKFTQQIPEYSGQNVFDTNRSIIKRLKQEHKLVLHQTIEHNYPHCWRCNTPLVYRALPSWYVAVTEFKQRLIDANQQINWIPEHVKDGQFGKWIEGARDWSISRNRYFGAPIPVWKCDKCDHQEVFGAIKQLNEFFKVEVKDLHRPYIDELVAPCTQCHTGILTRVPDVLDCWFESGSMPFAHVHYPVENKKWFDENFPADFIVEYIAQTRGWFYTLNVLSVALFDKPSFKNVICHGVILDKLGRKLSKRLRNYPDPMAMFNIYGADAMRWYLIDNPILKGGNFAIDDKGTGIEEVVKNILLPWWNVYYFFTMYSNIDGYRAELDYSSDYHLDQYILSELHNTVNNVEQAMMNYEISEATDYIKAFMEVLTNWYLRRSRRRFWKSENDQDKLAAYNTLYTVLIMFSKTCAPFLPFLTEYIFQSLTFPKSDFQQSVHLEFWPDYQSIPFDHELLEKMRLVRKIVRLGHSLRKKENIRVRQPLAEISISGEHSETILEFEDLIRDELNVKKVKYEDDPHNLGTPVLKVQAKLVGPRLGGKVQQLIKAGKQGDFQFREGDKVEVLGEVLSPQEYEVQWEAKPDSDCVSEGDLVVSLDLKITPDLEQEGLARELIRQIQNARAQANLQVSDRIKLSLIVPSPWQRAAEAYQELILAETLGMSIDFSEKPSSWFSYQDEALGDIIKIYLTKIDS
ncbi:MAG: hypothetical protein APR63_06650 [Desulfuromonas sp. SDB]|nr:MAG: hypothetical protein APR63_06650 [Desulfuromonas sp. SDB]